MSVLIDAILIVPPYVCLALAFGLLYGMLGFMDLTISVRFATAAYGGWCASRVLGRYPAFDVAVVGAAFTGSFAVSVLCWFLLKPLSRTTPLMVLVGSMGLMVAGQSALQAIFGPTPKVYLSYPVEEGIPFLGTTATALQLVGVGYAVLAVVGIGVFLHVGAWGKKLQAVASAPEVAEAVCGIPPGRAAWISTILTAAVIAPAAVVYTAGHGVEPTTGTDMALFAFVSTIVAGRERPLGAVAVTVILVVVRSVAIRCAFPIVLLGLLVVVALSYLWKVNQYKSDSTKRVSLSLLIAGGALLLVLASLKQQTLFGPKWVISPAFQNVVPYVLICLALLMRPQGILVLSKQRRA